jgi:hypothetical protein
MVIADALIPAAAVRSSMKDSASVKMAMWIETFIDATVQRE